MLPRKQYLEKLIQKRENGRAKVITGLRRCGKSVLLFHLYKDYLISEGVPPEQIIGLALDILANAKYRNPIELDNHIREQITDNNKQYYVFIDEIQFVSEIPNPYVNDPEAKITFIDVVLGLMQMPNVDVYVTGSNSKMLSSDILTQFRDRGDEIRVFPLSFAEFYEAYEEDKRGAWQDYYTYGGMPVVTTLDTHEEKSRYLRDLFSRTYLKDVLERHKIVNQEEVLEILLDVLASGIGSLTNPNKLSNTFKSERRVNISPETIDHYLDYFLDAFLIQKAMRYDVKGRKYIKTPSKYYYSDPGLRNARLGFRQLEETHLMENVLYNDLIRRGLDVDVGVVEYNTKGQDGKSMRKQLEVDFVVNRGSDRFYVQSALSIADPEKKEQEIASLLRIPDSFKKIVVVKDYLKPWTDEHGIQYIGIEQFLLDEGLLKSYDAAAL
ncbi:MAG: ATP-binding protein [Lachnospiraceae bacterium]|nr:ATP-binding protein [Lachnospiraceae bacterium]